MEQYFETPKRWYGWWWVWVFFLLVLATAIPAWSYFGNGEVVLEIPSGLDRTGLVELIGEELWWSQSEKQGFADIYAQMQWAEFNDELAEIFTNRFDWPALEQEAFLTHSMAYITPELDSLGSVYESGSYVVNKQIALPELARVLITRVTSEAAPALTDFIDQHINEEAAKRVAHFVSNQVELLPDLAPLPAQDLTVEQTADGTYLLFTTVYVNQGTGPLELRADPETKGIRADIDRDVLQRVYRSDDTSRDKVVGNFMWHQEHLHYHFADFVEYDLEAVDAPQAPDLSGVRVKSTFCVRDVSLVEGDFPDRPAEAAYTICGKELQGISVGWGDTYFYTYPDQRLNVTDLPSGTYRLSFTVNPAQRFDEVAFDNNKSSVLFKLDQAAKKVEVVETVPTKVPSIEHIHYEQIFN